MTPWNCSMETTSSSRLRWVNPTSKCLPITNATCSGVKSRLGFELVEVMIGAATSLAAPLQTRLFRQKSNLTDLSGQLRGLGPHFCLLRTGRLRLGQRKRLDLRNSETHTCLESAPTRMPLRY